MAILSTRNALLSVGLLAFLLGGLSIADMYRQRPWDGVVLESDAPGRLVVRKVVVASGAAAAGIRKGEQIIGIDRNVLRSTADAAELLNARKIGERVPYLVRGSEGLREVPVELGPRRIGSPAYFYACILGFSFFFVGLWVLLKQPRLRAAQIFFIQSALFFLFLVCRLRPASYSWIDTFVLTTGMVAILFLPASFLHFFLIFPRAVGLRPTEGEAGYERRRRLWLALLGVIYLAPPLVLVGSVIAARQGQYSLALISGAPPGNWWALAGYMLLGLSVLAVNGIRLPTARERRGAALVLFGSLFGLLPFLISAVAFPELLHSEKHLVWGLGPLILVPLTFAYAIVVFRLLDIKVILRKSLLYTVTTAVVTILWAGSIVLFNSLTSGTSLAASPFFPLLFALAIVVLFDPLRRGIQVVVDRFFYSGRGRLVEALEEMGEALAGQADLQPVVHDLVETLPQRVGLEFAALYLIRSGSIERVAGPDVLPEKLPQLPWLFDRLARRRGLTRVEELESLAGSRDDVADFVDVLSRAGVRVIGGLASARRRIGLVLLSEKVGQLGLDESELVLLRRLLDQAALAMETSLLIEERTEQAELERELEIASSVQAELLPQSLNLGPGWHVTAVCRPARHVGGDFFTELPGPREGSRAVVWGDVAGKSVSGALVMMAAHEVLQSLALTHRDPEELLTLANRRLYGFGKRKSFVALAYLTSSADGKGLEYLLAGQPQPLVRQRDGMVRELPLPENRMPLGALNNGRYRVSYAPVDSGDVVLGYSDGVVDARSTSGEVFGSERLAEIVSDAPGEPQAVVARVVEALEMFTRGTEPYDDVTLVAIGCGQEVV
ncbi:MAG: SpoIIE family protein phosphatase [Acidobacteriota bacterium]|nr:SpoIIE family protein phosphatase [Acidobacteriota bacterium]